MATATVNGAELAYDDTGGDGPAVILSHGFLMDRTMFEPQVEALRTTHRVITWDERGFGDTVYDGEPFTYWDSAADCFGLLDHLGIDRAVLGGMSQGGFLSLRAALLAPERVRALVLIDTQAGTEDPEVAPLYQGMIDDWVANGPSDMVAGIVSSIIVGDEQMSMAWIKKWQMRPKEAMLQPSITLMTRDDIWDRLGEISCPALVIHGTADAAIGMDKAERLAAGLSGCDGVTVIEDGTHAANLTHPDQVNAAMQSFLATL